MSRRYFDFKIELEMIDVDFLIDANTPTFVT